MIESRTDKEKTSYEQNIAVSDRQIIGLVFKLYDLTDNKMGLIEDRFQNQKSQSGGDYLSRLGPVY